MANKAGKPANAGKKSNKLAYFYLDVPEHGLLLHRKLQIIRAADKIITWCYPLGKRVAYTYSDVRKNHRPAFTMKEVCGMLGRGRTSMEMAIVNGHISKPQMTYSIDANRNPYKYMFSEDNVMEAHAYFSSVHRGRPRKDGRTTPANLPSPRELRAMMRNDEVLYVQTADGEFRPVWHAPDFS